MHGILKVMSISHDALVQIFNNSFGMNRFPANAICDKFEELFGVIPTQPGKNFCECSHCGRHLDSPEYTGDGSAVETESLTVRISVEEVQGGFVSHGIVLRDALYIIHIHYV